MFGNGRSYGTAIAVVGLFVMTMAFLGAAGGVAGATGVSDAAELSDAAGAEGAIETSTGTDPLKNETGTTDVIVRFPPLDDPDAEGDAVVDELRSHAAEERDTFESFAEEHPAVSIEREFWLANAVLVTVDADAVDAAELLAVENVTRIHENVEMETYDATQDADGTETASAPVGPKSTADATSHGTMDGTIGPVETASIGVTAASGSDHTPGLERIAVPAAWERFGTRGDGATVAVIDTGVDPGHQDIDLEAWASFDVNGTLVSDDVADANDPEGHGTHVAGTIVGGDASGTHIGVAPDAALHGIDAFGEDGTATFASVLAGMQRATADDDVDVIQMSLGASGTFGGFIAPVRNARAADKVVVAAVGNEGHGTSSSPANVYDSLAVGAASNDRTVAEFSSGQSINKTDFANPPDEWPDRYVVPDVTAPGVAVVSAEAGTTDGYVELQGTSMAAPHVGGIAALSVAATDGRIDGDGAQKAILGTAVHPDGATEPDDRHGYGFVDAEAAVGAAMEAAPPTPTPSPTPPPTDTPEEVEPIASDDDAPGFGVTVAIGALLATLLVTRGTVKRRR